MILPDVVGLKQFYASALGRYVQSRVLSAMARVWSAPNGEAVLGLGYAAPYLDAMHQAELSVAVMPPAQGAIYWPPSQANRTAMARETSLPFKPEIFNRVVVAHLVEHGAHTDELLDEVWRVLAPSGRVIMIVPNRLSLWARSASTPFGYGKPYSLAQCRALLANHQLTYLQATPVLFIPPRGWRWVLKCAGVMDILGPMFWPMLGGIWLIEAEKQIYASVMQPVTVSRRAMLSPAAVTAKA